MRKSDGGIFTRHLRDRRGVHRRRLQLQARRRPLLRRRLAGRRCRPANATTSSRLADGDGHGSHTASIAAGNHGVRAVVDDRDFGRISGVAPAAKIASYKVLWQAKKPDRVRRVRLRHPGGDRGGDRRRRRRDQLLDQLRRRPGRRRSRSRSWPRPRPASSSPPRPATPGPARRRCRAPRPGSPRSEPTPSRRTTARSPWATGRSTPASPPRSTSRSVRPGWSTVRRWRRPAETAANATACVPDSLDPAKTAGTIVVCARGVVDRTVKSAEVERAGGIGMVLVNLTANTLDADLHSVPTVHVDPPASTPSRRTQPRPAPPRP